MLAVSSSHPSAALPVTDRPRIAVAAESEPATESGRIQSQDSTGFPRIKEKFHFSKCYMSRDSSVGIATGYGLDVRMFGVRFPARAGNFSFRHYVQTGSEVHPESYPTGTGGSLLGGKATGA
jgi:hypothetical protein